jgi:hypothetical protein
MTNGCPKYFPANTAKTRAIVSLLPPAAYGTINLIGLLGQLILLSTLDVPTTINNNVTTIILFFIIMNTFT